MRLECRLRDLRGDRSLKAMQEQTRQAGHEVSSGILSQIERGMTLPTDEQAPALEQAYGAPRTSWYDEQALLAIQRDEAA